MRQPAAAPATVSQCGPPILEATVEVLGFEERGRREGGRSRLASPETGLLLGPAAAFASRTRRPHAMDRIAVCALPCGVARSTRRAPMSRSLSPGLAARSAASCVLAGSLSASFL